MDGEGLRSDGGGGLFKLKGGWLLLGDELGTWLGALQGTALLLELVGLLGARRLDDAPNLYV